jgi:flagellar biosynthetic protein FlhB
MVLLAVVAVLSTVLSGGLVFSVGLMAPKLSKLNPLAGFGRMFGMKAVIELGKAILKFLLISVILWMSVTNHIDDLVSINRMDLGTAIHHAGNLILDACFWMCMGLIVIALADVPLQHYQTNKRLKMTRQEIKDEMKNSEGRPEVKATIRRRQREMANNRMMENVKDADVVITNPQHFAVALSYDPNSDGAPWWPKARTSSPNAFANVPKRLACICLKPPSWPGRFTSPPNLTIRSMKVFTTRWRR